MIINNVINIESIRREIETSPFTNARNRKY